MNDHKAINLILLLNFAQIHGVYCLNTKRIAIAGKIRVFCFDKTGTLTNDGLDFVGIQGVENSIVNNESRFRPTQSPWKHELIDDVILRGFATCHAVTKFGAQFVGNEVEVLLRRNCERYIFFEFPVWHSK